MSVTLQQLVFYAFSFLAIVSATSVVLAKNPVRAVLFLVLTFFAMAGNWMLMEAEFLAIVLVLVYVGAVMVLFLFVVMMLDVETASLTQSFVRHWPISLAISLVLILLMGMAVTGTTFSLESMPEPLAKAADYSHVKALATLLYSDYLLPFEIAGVILLVAMIAAIGLAFRGSQSSRSQRVHEQVRVKKADRLEIVKMRSNERVI